MNSQFFRRRVSILVVPLVIIILLIHIPAASETADLQTVGGLFTRISDKVGSIDTIRFSFVQNIYIAESTQTVKAEVLFRRPDSLCVKYSEPQLQEIYYSEGYLFTYLPKIEQATKQRRNAVSDILGITPSIILSDKPLEGLQKRFNLSIAGSSDDIMLRATPIDTGVEFDDMTIVFNAATLLPVRTIVSAPHFSSETQFIEYSINPEVDNSFFKFDPPVKVNIIEID